MDNSPRQRVLNDLQRTSISCSFIIRFLDHPLPLLSPVNKLSLFHSLPVSHRSSILTGSGGWSRSQIIRPRESLSCMNHSILSGTQSKPCILSLPFKYNANTRESYLSVPRPIKHDPRARICKRVRSPGIDSD